jgi:RNA polymerase sigma factor (sigma-70 family)
MAVNAADRDVERGWGEEDVRPATPTRTSTPTPTPAPTPAPTPTPANCGLGEEDERRLAQLVRAEYSKVLQVVRALCGSHVDPEGVVAEATARAIERLSSGRPIEDVRAWVTTTAVNLGRSDLRRQRVRRRYAPLLAADVRSHTTDTDASASRLDVQAALQQLPRRQAEVVALYYGLDLSIRQIASSLHRSEGTIKATLFKARQALGTTLARPPREGDDE